MTMAAEKLAGHPVVEKKDEKVEKRRALGRGLESLLPGPRAVGTSAVQRPSSSPPFARNASDGAPGIARIQDEGSPSEKQVPHFVRNDKILGDDDKASRAQDERVSIQAQATPGDLVVNLAIDSIEKNPYQTRQVFNEQTLIELRDSIKEHGVVQPVVVRPAEAEGRYVLVLGERRLRASKMAGKETIPALLRRVSPQQAAEMTVLENVVREDLNPLEQAKAFQVLSKEFYLTQAQIAERIGVSRETVSNYMRLLKLPEKVMGYMLEDRLSFSDARLILALENPEHIQALADEVVTKHMKWDEIEDRVMRINGAFSPMPGAEKKSRGARWMDPNVRAAQTDMERTLGMRVRIRDRNGKGRIVIEYASVDDYERMVEMLRGK